MLPTWNYTSVTNLELYQCYQPGTIPVLPTWNYTSVTNLELYQCYQPGTIPVLPTWNYTSVTNLELYQCYQPGTIPVLPTWNYTSVTILELYQCYQPGERKLCEHSEWDLGACPPPPSEKLNLMLKNVHSVHLGGYNWINLQCLMLSFSGTIYGMNLRKRLFAQNPWVYGPCPTKSVRVTEVPWGLATLLYCSF